MAEADLTAARLRELLHYNPETGVFTRKVDAIGHQGCVRARAGSVADRPQMRGYLRCAVDGKRYQSNRLAWLYMTGEWPEHEVDHRDGNPSNNRWTNLRELVHQHNIENRRRANKNSAARLLGTSLLWNGTWQASISSKGKKVHLGTFSTPEEAHQAYLAAKRRLHEGNTL